jgi:hypothetical protein
LAYERRQVLDRDCRHADGTLSDHELRSGDVSLLIGLLGKIGFSPVERGKMNLPKSRARRLYFLLVRWPPLFANKSLHAASCFWYSSSHRFSRSVIGTPSRQAMAMPVSSSGARSSSASNSNVSSTDNPSRTRRPFSSTPYRLGSWSNGKPNVMLNPPRIRRGRQIGKYRRPLSRSW